MGPYILFPFSLLSTREFRVPWSLQAIREPRQMLFSKASARWLPLLPGGTCESGPLELWISSGLGFRRLKIVLQSWWTRVLMLVAETLRTSGVFATLTVIGIRTAQKLPPSFTKLHQCYHTISLHRMVLLERNNRGSRNHDCRCIARDSI